MTTTFYTEEPREEEHIGEHLVPNVIYRILDDPDYKYVYTTQIGGGIILFNTEGELESRLYTFSLNMKWRTVKMPIGFRIHTTFIQEE